MKKKQKSNKILFNVTDPRNKIVICEENGFIHALKGHPEITDKKIKETIIDPDYIRESKQQETRHLYHSVQSTTSKCPQCFITVVGFDEKYDKGRVITAFEGSDSGSKGPIIWTRK